MQCRLLILLAALALGSCGSSQPAELAATDLEKIEPAARPEVDVHIEVDIGAGSVKGVPADMVQTDGYDYVHLATADMPEGELKLYSFSRQEGGVLGVGATAETCTGSLNGHRCSPDSQEFIGNLGTGMDGVIDARSAWVRDDAGEWVQGIEDEAALVVATYSSGQVLSSEIADGVGWVPNGNDDVVSLEVIDVEGTILFKLGRD